MDWWGMFITTYKSTLFETNNYEYYEKAGY
jgi:hypothetical protein